MPRCSCTYKITGTKTFRLGSSSILGEWGTNMQNWEKGIRKLFIPDPRKVFIQTDQSGAEALIVGYLCKSGNKLRELFKNSIKPHTYLGLKLPQQWEKQFPMVHQLATLDLPILKQNPDWLPLSKAIAESDNNPPATRYYYHYKQTCHSANYGIGPSTFQMNLLDKSGGKVVLTNKQAKAYLDSYNEMIPELREWHHEVRNQLYESNTLHNLFGHPFYFNTVNDSMLKEAYAVIPQSTVGCITHYAYITMQSYIESNGLKEWDLLANTHDSYLLQVPDDKENIEHCVAMSQMFMNQELTSPRGEKFNMKSEAQVGRNWSPASSDKNPHGLMSVKDYLKIYHNN